MVFNDVRWLWLKSLKRRSQNSRLSWEKFTRLVDRFFPPIRVLHPMPCHRFDAKTREEPCALAAHAGTCAGGEEQSFSLPRQWQPPTRCPRIMKTFVCLRLSLNSVQREQTVGCG